MLPGEEPLQTTKHEIFAQALAEGLTLEASHAKAGYAVNRANAHTLKRRDDIQTRVSFLLGLRVQVQTEATQKAVETLGLTKAWVIQQAKDVLAEARESQEHAPALKAIELLGREVGAFIEKKEIRTGPLEGTEADELSRIREEIISERARRIRAGSEAPDGSKPH